VLSKTLVTRIIGAKIVLLTTDVATKLNATTSSLDIFLLLFINIKIYAHAFC
jgi:hypothetical protein